MVGSRPGWCTVGVVEAPWLERVLRPAREILDLNTKGLVRFREDYSKLLIHLLNLS